jgi:hypothetical protein
MDDIFRPADRAKLAAVLGMIGSAHDGEALNAARLADRLVRQTGLTWRDILSEPPGQLPTPRLPMSWRDTVSACLRRPAHLSAWEAQFLRSLARFPRLSARQTACLRSIADRVLAEAAA